MQQAEQILINKSIRPTAMRILLMEHFLQSSSTSFSLTELEAIFNHSDRITIYRTLKTFQEKGVLHTIEGGTNSLKYALCEEECGTDGHQDQHPHFHCTSCDQIQCIEAVYIPKINLPQGFKINSTSMTIKGQCANCTL